MTAKTTVAEPSSAPTSVVNHVPAVSAVCVGQEAHAAPLATARCGRVTKELIDAACAEFWRELHAKQGRDADVNEATDRCGIRVEIARSVTPQMFEDILDDWLVGMDVALREDGVLELLDTEGNEHRKTKTGVCLFVASYASAHGTAENGLMAMVEQPGVYHGIKCTPDCVLSANYLPADQLEDEEDERPLLVVEVEVHRRGILELIKQARLYLSEQHVIRVVTFKFFDHRVATNSAGRLSKAAIAVVFERVGDVQPGELADIQVVDEVSFGTAALDGQVLTDLSTVPSRTTPAGRRRYVPPSPLEIEGAVPIRVSDIRARLPLLPAHILNVDLSPVMMEPLAFHLHDLFRDAVKGWYQDLPDTYRRRLSVPNGATSQ